MFTELLQGFARYFAWNSSLTLQHPHFIYAEARSPRDTIMSFISQKQYMTELSLNLGLCDSLQPTGPNWSCCWDLRSVAREGRPMGSSRCGHATPLSKNPRSGGWDSLGWAGRHGAQRHCKIRYNPWNSPGGSVARALCFHAGGPGSISGWRTISHKPDWDPVQPNK